MMITLLCPSTITKEQYLPFGQTLLLSIAIFTIITKFITLVV